MIVVFGLGNPGLQYKRTRHNLGYCVISELVGLFHKRLRRSGSKVYSTVITLPKQKKIVLAKNATFMNTCGIAVAEVMRLHHVSIQDLLVVQDDMDLALGRIRFRRSGRHGGHNGLRSIIETVGHSQFARLKLGIGQALDGEDVDFVLGKFGPGERSVIERMIKRAAKAVHVFVRKGLDQAMNEYNDIQVAGGK